VSADAGDETLQAVARRVMLEEGLAPEFPPEVVAEVRALAPLDLDSTTGTDLRDLRGLLWSSIDNLESRDLDQIEYAERGANGGIRVLVGIADVDAYVPAGSAIDQHAAHNGASVYTGVVTFSMLPERLSTDLTSLVEGADRLVIVCDFVVAPDGDVGAIVVYRALAHNSAKLDYVSVGAWLEGAGPMPARIRSLAGLEEQVRLQDEAAERLRGFRQRRGALDLETIEASVVADGGKAVDLVVKRKQRATYLIESLMIAANTAFATFLESSGVASIQRVVRTPERWPRIVELAARLGARLPPEPDVRALSAFLARRRQADSAGYSDLSLAVVKLIGAGEYLVEGPEVEVSGHFGLAIDDYTHATAPNRRYVDLVIQRMLKAVLAGRPTPYDEAALAAIAARSNECDRAERKVERRMRKHAAAEVMSHRVGQVFDAIITGATAKGTFARLVAPAVEGMIVRGERGLDVGERVRVRLAATDTARGFIDFEREG
jgi:VacB/RNase II family 3'-5' exoribonuclease